jgi:CRP-like cAMP-binding protein
MALPSLACESPLPTSPRCSLQHVDFPSLRLKLGRRKLSSALPVLCSFLIAILALMPPTAAAAALLPCESLSAENGLHVESMPSSTCLTGVDQLTALYNRADNADLSSDHGLFDILLPFPFRWFDSLYNSTSVFVSANSYITFGGSQAVNVEFFNPFYPSFPSVLVGAADNIMQRLYVGWVSQGWLVHYEAAPYADDVEPDSSTVVWELLFLKTGGLQLCTGNVTDATQQPFPLSAISNQKSPKFVHTFTLQAQFKYSFVTSCATVNRVSLSTPITSASGIQLNVILFLALNASDVSTWTITLRGAGFSCPPNSVVSLISSPPILFSVGVASISASDSSSPVLVVSGITGAINGSVMLSFNVNGLSAPYQPQNAVPNLGFAVQDRSGRLVASGNNVQLCAILSPVSLDNMPSLKLSNPVILQSNAELVIELSPKPTNEFGQYAFTTLVITVAGSGWWFNASNLDLQTVYTSASIVASGSRTSVIRIVLNLQTFQGISSKVPLFLSISPITTPNLIQDSLSNIKCGILNADNSVIASGNRGTLGAISASTMGSNAPSVSFSTPAKSLRDVVLTVKMVPTFQKFESGNIVMLPSLILPVSGPAIVITLSGQGITCPDNTAVTFLLPFSGASGSASISNEHMLPVLRVTISSGTFAAGLPIWFQISSVSTPSFEQPDVNNVTAAILCCSSLDDPPAPVVVVASSTSGTIDRIVGGMGPNQPTIQHTILNGIGKISLLFTPSASLPDNSIIIVTLSGIALTCAQFTPVVFISPVFRVLGSASFINEPFSNVLMVSVPGEISAGSNVSFFLTPVFTSFTSNSTFSNISASAIDSNGKILAASNSGSFEAMQSSLSTVKEFISSASNGTIVLPAGVLAGRANCNNVIDETMPPRVLGSSVVLKSSGSGTTIDCSSTTMRCLVVYRSSITITNVTFRGGASANFVLSSTVRSIRALYDAISGVSPQSQPAVPLQSNTASRLKTGRRLEATATSTIDGPHPRNIFNSRSQTRYHAAKGTNLTGPTLVRPGTEKHSRRIGAAGKNRQLLESLSLISAMFPTDQNDCGGCILVDAADYNVSLFDVTFLGCSAVYGGGGFFNVSAFSASKGLASNNVARQGGGFFVVSAVGSSIKNFTFINNTVATFLPSKYEITPNLLPLGKFSRLPDPLAAAGGGAWFQRLNSAENCLFLDNNAIAASTSDKKWENNAMHGAHALGSGMFVIETRTLPLNSEIRLAVLTDLIFKRSQQLCAGWCVAGGALFLGKTDGGTKMARFHFESTSSAAVSSEMSVLSSDNGIGPSVALGSCVVIGDMSSTPVSTIRDVHASSISSRAVGSILGGCISILQAFSNSTAFNISVSRASLISVGHKGGIYGGVLYALNSAQIQVSEIVTDFITLQSGSRIYGGVIYIFSCVNAVITRIVATNAAISIVNPAISAECHGGVLYLDTSSDTLISNFVASNIRLQCSISAQSDQRCQCHVFGGVLFTRNALRVNFSESLSQNLSMHCNGASCSTSGGMLFMNYVSNTSVFALSSFNSSLFGSGTSSINSGGVLTLKNEAKLYTNIYNIKSTNSSVACSGTGCYCYGGLIFAFKLSTVRNTSYVCSNTSTLLSNIESSGVSVACRGNYCFVLGGIAYFEEAYCLSVSNVQANHSAVSSSGTSSQAVGSLFGFGASNSSFFTSIQSLQSIVSSDGDYSQAIGGALSVLSGNVSLSDCVFSRSTVRCAGYQCSALGGFVSAVSTLIYNANYNNQITIVSSLFAFGSVTCSGSSCFTSGGAIAVGTSYRASEWLGVASPSLSTKSPPPMLVDIRNCRFVNNTVSSVSVAASAGGGAVSIRASVATMSNCTFWGNSILFGDLISFAGGGALFVSQSNCLLTASDCSFSLNNASSVGQGGAVLVSVGAKFVGSKLTISHNYAGKGGGILVDAAIVQISNSDIQNNFAVSSGGGLFCSSNQANDVYAARGLTNTGLSTIALQNVSVRSNTIVDPLALGVGAEMFIIGSVVFSADSTSEVSMDGNSERDVTAAVVSLVTNSPNIFLKLACRSGTMLRIAPTSLSNVLSLSNPPSMVSMLASNCFPACSEVPSYETYRATSGFLASCTPCPRGTYSFGISNVTSDKVSTFCRACPFGAVCGGGDAVFSQKMHWGWRDSEHTAASRFAFLQPGYGCTNCSSMASCAGHRNGILCGGCEAGYSLALFQTGCVPNSQCQIWKVGLVVGMCIVYQLLFSFFLFWSVESELLEERVQSTLDKETALLNLSLFERLKTYQIRSAAADLVEEAIAPDTTVLSQGQTAQYIYIISEGVFDVFIKPEDGLEVKVAELRAPQCFGELSFLGNAPCAATVRAATPCRVWRVDGKCLEDVDDAAALSFLAKQKAAYSRANQQRLKSPRPKTSLYEAFDVLLWFYQLAGIMLTMSSPLDYLDGSAIAYSIVSFFLNMRPSTDSISTLNNAASGQSSLSFEALSQKFAFCFVADFNATNVFAATLLYYVCWALIILMLSRRSVWLHVRRPIVFLFKTVVSPLSRMERVRLYLKFLDERSISSFQIQGAVLLRWCITCFSAISILMLQGTQCLNLQGIDARGGTLRWLFDGRVACFSSQGDLSGTWQIGSGVGVVVALVSPAILMIGMMGIDAADPELRSPLHSIALAAYSGPYAEGASHWTIVM